MATLFSPLKLGSVTLNNRIIIAPMCMYSAEQGVVQPWHHQHYGMLAQSGAGLLIVEASAVSPEGRISYADSGIYNDECEQAWREVVNNVHQYSDIPMVMQIGHAGRKASTDLPWNGGTPLTPEQDNGWQTIAPSALPFAQTDPTPQAMTEADIEQLIAQFVAAAQRAYHAGFCGVEVHAAHGYLLHQFLSPISNQRGDQFGGSLENRMRLPLAVFDAIKAALPDDFMIGVRISASDWAEGGWDIEQSIEFSKALDACGCHYMHVSSGGLTEKQQIEVGPNYQVGFADAISNEVSMPVIAVGLITQAQQAEDIINHGQADAIALARGILYDPRWPWHAAAELGATIQAAPQYLRCQPHGLKSLLTR
ncbi:NADH:flavin oxidoreductase/NADH oxidase [Vibrio palustris]|uniref:NADPH dehydrogenase n=1 Tax=Vibrio palustris TaxID=1918946 RepID=A0A1R4B390_9VIBR|nr:NADH:flavin oxidoreductase/NADH oxidase [Vibrio palustris]SJL83388.1 NADPH dehydrogenase [Vibrio palustris]